jgi:hypothetical protein
MKTTQKMKLKKTLKLLKGHSSTNHHIQKISYLEIKKVQEKHLTDDGWIVAMQDELNQFQRNDVWDLVPRPTHKNIIGTK